MEEKKQDEEYSLNNCLNCETALDKLNKFCPTCGQKARDRKLTVARLLGDFFSNLFNLDARVFKTIPALFVPAKLSREYIGGKRKSYLNPARLFLVSMIIHFGLLSWLGTVDIDQGAEGKIYKDAFYTEIAQKYDSLGVLFLNNDSILIDTLRNVIFATDSNIKDSISITNFIVLGDEAEYPEIKISASDAVNKSPKEIIELYGITGFIKKLNVSQQIKFLKNSNGLVKFIVGNLLWGIALLVFFISWFLKLLYIRSGKYYVEHLILQFNIHSFSFLIISLTFVIVKAFENILDSVDISLFLISYCLILPAYFLVSFKKYYGQGWIKTSLKLIITSLVYLFLLILFIVIISFISMALF